MFQELLGDYRAFFDRYWLKRSLIRRGGVSSRTGSSPWLGFRLTLTTSRFICCVLVVHQCDGARIHIHPIEDTRRGDELAL